MIHGGVECRCTNQRLRGPLFHDSNAFRIMEKEMGVDCCPGISSIASTIYTVLILSRGVVFKFVCRHPYEVLAREGTMHTKSLKYPTEEIQRPPLKLARELQ